MFLLLLFHFIILSWPEYSLVHGCASAGIYVCLMFCNIFVFFLLLFGALKIFLQRLLEKLYSSVIPVRRVI